MLMHLLSGGRLRMPRHIYYPGTPAEDWFEMPVSCALFRHKQGIALFDTGCHPDAAIDGKARWGDHALYSEPIFDSQDAVIGQLGVIGLSAADIDVVICSHLHYDHCGCNAFFTGATIICHANELAAARAVNAVPMGYLRNDWDVGQAIQTIQGDHDVFGDGRLTLMPLPGHTPGSIGAHAVLDRSGTFLLASDAAPVEASLRQRYAPANTVDVDLYLSSLDTISEYERDGAKVLFGHDDAQWRQVRKGADCYD
jgi:glyoxylase-like metal-dependent hydrolase (beta-lactamase superfamily II)